jgi:hypothetical protein
MWTPEMVKARLIEAASVLRRLPRTAAFSRTWPQIVYHTFEAQAGRTSRPPPSSASINRMDEVLGWLVWLEPIDSRIVWMRVNGRRWKAICWAVGLGRAGAHEHWLYALYAITWRLNGKELLKHVGKRRLIARSRSMGDNQMTSLADTFRSDSLVRNR